ncbi:MAG: nucleotidyltransferase domain-containing protein [Chlamydiae bacterium]|nr:nucleotidyltransferase domain-containing protein [Chlamydiota bacterium]MBI3277979.1 nucleotidyltransferase domain-containing protein [Chlamydiota bacterium]
MSLKEDKYLVRLREMVTDFFKGEDAKVVLYGSRARGTHHATSDVDIGIIPKGKQEIKIFLLREKIEESTIPYKVDVVNLKEASPRFKRAVMKDAVIWKN